MHTMNTKKYINLLIIFLAIPILLFAQSEEKKIVFKTSQHDFGTLKQGTAAEFMFEYTNVSHDTIYLDNPKASCGCTAALMSEDMLLPNKTGYLKVRFVPPIGSHGSVTKTVTMYYRGGQTIEMLRIFARVIGDLEPGVDYMRFDGVVGIQKTEKVLLKNISDQTVRLDNMSASLMEYRDTTAGDQYHSDKVIAKPFTNFALSTVKKDLTPGESTDLVFVFTPEDKGQINGSIRVTTGKYETIISVAGVVLRPKNSDLKKNN